jgi:hypothetical protein
MTVGRLRASVLALAMGLVACQTEKPSPIHVDLGPAGERTFLPRTAIAESLVIPGDHNELRLLLAEGDASCERHIPPKENQVLLTVTILAPDQATIGPGTYAWTQPAPPKRDEKAPLPVHAVPKVHLGANSYLLQPGGGIQLTVVDLEPNGSVQGVLAFDFPGNGKLPATRIQGRFAARVCRPGGRNAN